MYQNPFMTLKLDPTAGFNTRRRFSFRQRPDTTPQNCPPGYSWDAATNSCVPNPYARQEDPTQTPYQSTQPRLDQFGMDGQITTANIPDVYSLTAKELPLYGIDINANNTENAPSGFVSGWRDLNGDGFDDDGHAMGPNGPVNVQTAQGEQSIQNVLADASLTDEERKKKKIQDVLLSIGGALAGLPIVGKIVSDIIDNRPTATTEEIVTEVERVAPTLQQLQEAGGDNYSGGIQEASKTIGYDETGRGYDQYGNPTNAFESVSAWTDALSSPGHGHKDEQYTSTPAPTPAPSTPTPAPSVPVPTPSPVRQERNDDNDPPSSGNSYSVGGSGVSQSVRDANEAAGGYTGGGRHGGFNYGGIVRRNEGGDVPRYMNDGSLANHPYEREGEQFDQVPAMLTEGEFVVDADSTHKLEQIAPGLLKQINEWEPSDDEDEMRSTLEVPTVKELKEDLKEIGKLLGKGDLDKTQKKELQGIFNDIISNQAKMNYGGIVKEFDMLRRMK